MHLIRNMMGNILQILNLFPEMTVEGAHRSGIWCGICGELGADLELTEKFVAMGMDELSVSPASVLPLRQKIRGL